jgi:hypothetical protein
MNEKRVVNVKCPQCNTTLQVKTRSAEKVVACPKCQTSMKVLAGASAAPAPEALPEAAYWQEPAEPLPFAEPTGLPYAAPMTSAPGTHRALVIAISASAAVVLVAVGVFFAMRAGGGGGTSQQPELVNQINPIVPQSGGQGAVNVPSEIVQGENTETEQGQGAFVQQPIPQPIPQVVPQPQQNNAAAAQDKVNRAAARVSSLERQKRDWLLANSGRLRASGVRVIVWPNERLLDQARQELEMARRELEGN